MTISKANEKRIGNYIRWDAEKEPATLRPLLECLRFAINDLAPLDYWIGRMFPASEPQYAGGDPGWQITNYDPATGEILSDADGAAAYRCWIHPDYCDVTEGEYDVATLKSHIHRTLMNFAEAHPDRRAEVEEVVARYTLDSKSSLA